MLNVVVDTKPHYKSKSLAFKFARFINAEVLQRRFPPNCPADRLVPNCAAVNYDLPSLARAMPASNHGDNLDGSGSTGFSPASAVPSALRP